MFKQKKIIILFSFLCCCFFAVQVIYSSDDEKIETENLADTTIISQDSLYAQINQSFQTVKPMLEASCYDCHSANTNEPWYFNIPGVNSLLTSHVKEAREHLDFTNGFPFKSKESQRAILHELKEEVEEGEMPLLSYRLMHWGLLIENEQQDSLFQWIDETILLLDEFENNKS